MEPRRCAAAAREHTHLRADRVWQDRAKNGAEADRAGSAGVGAYAYAGQLAAFVETLSKSAAADYTGPAGEARFKKLRAEMPADAKPANVTKRSDGSLQISVEGQQNGITIEYLLTVVMEAGAWKIGK